jgi:hypothetical protein
MNSSKRLARPGAAATTAANVLANSGLVRVGCIGYLVGPRVKDCVILNVTTSPADAHVLEVPLGKVLNVRCVNNLSACTCTVRCLSEVDRGRGCLWPYSPSRFPKPHP